MIYHDNLKYLREIPIAHVVGTSWKQMYERKSWSLVQITRGRRIKTIIEQIIVSGWP
jgi:hypothetical protein